MKEQQKATGKSHKGKIHFTFKGIRLGGCLFLFCIAACAGKNYDADYSKIHNLKSLLKNGDVIVRNGTDEISRTARSFNRKDKTYSHCGIIQIENDTVFVYHALGGSYNPSQKLLRQALEAFCDPGAVDKIAVFRYPLDQKEDHMLTAWLHDRYAAGLPFDIFFNFYTDDQMYCSEFVFKALDIAKNGTLLRLLPEDTGPVYVSIDDLYLNGEAKEVGKITF
ncbi:YiiX/YebB-like N1pC/P60 family cysteine hydrolase [Niabella aquatica]